MGYIWYNMSIYSLLAEFQEVFMKKTIRTLKVFFSSFWGMLVLIFLLYAPIVGLMVAFLTVFDAPIVAIIVGIFCSYFGWKILSRLTPNIFLVMPVGGWIAYYFVKAALSLFIGVFVTPVVIGRWIAKKLAESLASSIQAEDDITNKFMLVMSSIEDMNRVQLEKMHSELSALARKMPVPIDGTNYLKELKKFEKTKLDCGELYGCVTYGDAIEMNNAIVKRIDMLEEAK